MPHFEYIEYLYALLAIPFLVLLMFLTARWRKSALKKFGDHNLTKSLLHQKSNSRKVIRFLIVTVALAFIILGVANLRMGAKKEMVIREGSDIMIAFDVSKSMLTEDIKPNRLKRARIFAGQLLQELNNDKVGLTVFAGNAYLQMPLTIDSRAALMYLGILGPDMIPTQGTAIASAIRIAMDAFDNGSDPGQVSEKSRALIIVTDGENHEEDAIAMAKEAKEKGIKIYTIGVGTSKGAPIPVYRNGRISDRKKDKEGNIVLSKLNEKMLREIAIEGEGSYYNLSGGNQVIKDLKMDLEGLDKNEGEAYEFTAYRNHFQIFLGIALFLITLEFFLSDRKSNFMANLNLFDKKEKG